MFVLMEAVDQLQQQFRVIALLRPQLVQQPDQSAGGYQIAGLVDWIGKPMQRRGGYNIVQGQSGCEIK